MHLIKDQRTKKHRHSKRLFLFGLRYCTITVYCIVLELLKHTDNCKKKNAIYTGNRCYIKDWLTVSYLTIYCTVRKWLRWHCIVVHVILYSLLEVKKYEVSFTLSIYIIFNKKIHALLQSLIGQNKSMID